MANFILPKNTSSVLEDLLREQGTDLSGDYEPADRALTQAQIDSVLGLVNPPKPPEWAPLMTLGTPADPRAGMKKSSYKASSSTTSPLDTTPTLVEKGTPASEMDLSDKEMEAALQQQKDQIMTNILARTGVDLGHAISRVPGKSEDIIGKDFDTLANLPVEQLTQKRDAQYKKFSREKEMFDKKEAADPNSEHSASVRSLATSWLKMSGLDNIANTIQGMSAEQIDKKFPFISNLVNAKMAQDSKKEQAALLVGQKIEAKKTKEEEAKYGKEYNLSKAVAKTDDTLKYSQGVYNLEQFKNVVSSDPSGALDVALIYDYIKALDPNSAVREGEVDLVRTSSPFLQNVANLPQRITKGSLLPASTRAAILANIERFNQAKKKQFLSHLKPIANQIKTNKLNADNIFIGTPGVTTEEVMSGKSENSNIPKTVIKKFYSKEADKTKFVYSDGTEEIKDGRL